MVSETDAGNSSGAFAGNKSTMQDLKSTTEQDVEIIFSLMPGSALAGRLAREIRDLASEIASGPAAYMRVAFLPNRMEDWLPLSLARNLWDGSCRIVTHPVAVIRDASSHKTAIAGYIYAPAAHSLEFIADTVAPGAKKAARHSHFRPVLAVSGIAHTCLLGYLGFMALFGQYLGFRVVNKPYRKIDASKILAKLYYTPVSVKMESVTTPSTLEEAIEEERRRRERERAERERRRREAEEAARRAAEEAKEKEEEPVPTEFGEFNEKPIKDILQNVVTIYRDGKLDMAEIKFKVMLEFRIAKDGSIPKSSIKMKESSGSRIIDLNAVEILWQLGESHALMPLSNLSTNTIKLEVTDDIVRLTITGFAPTAKDAGIKVGLLNALKVGAQWKQRGTDTAEILSMLKVTSNNNRIDADLTVSRAKATELLNNRVPVSNPPH